MALITCKKCGKTFDAPANDVKKIHCLYCGAPIYQKPKKKNYLWLYILTGILCVAAIATLAMTKPWEKKVEVPVTKKAGIIQIAAGVDHTIGLRADGTVVAVGNKEDGQCDVEDWTDIVNICAGDYHTVGLKSDVTVVAVGYNRFGQCNVEVWRDIVNICASDCHTVGLKSDGTVVAVGGNFYGQCNVEDWNN